MQSEGRECSLKLPQDKDGWEYEEWLMYLDHKLKSQNEDENWLEPLNQEIRHGF